jgi:hypothetical protein
MHLQHQRLELLNNEIREVASENGHLLRKASSNTVYPESSVSSSWQDRRLNSHAQQTHFESSMTSMGTKKVEGFLKQLNLAFENLEKNSSVGSVSGSNKGTGANGGDSDAIESISRALTESMESTVLSHMSKQSAPLLRPHMTLPGSPAFTESKMSLVAPLNIAETPSDSSSHSLHLHHHYRHLPRPGPPPIAMPSTAKSMFAPTPPAFNVVESGNVANPAKFAGLSSAPQNTSRPSAAAAAAHLPVEEPTLERLMLSDNVQWGYVDRLELVRDPSSKLDTPPVSGRSVVSDDSFKDLPAHSICVSCLQNSLTPFFALFQSLKALNLILY